MNKPYVTCLMMTSIDGKIDGDFIEDEKAENLGNFYEEFKLQISDAWGNGSNTHKMYFGNNEVNFSEYKNKNVSYEDKIIKDTCPYVVCFDQRGRVNWNTKYLEYPTEVKNRIIEVLTKKVKKEYIAYLDEYEIPYIFAGEDKIDLKTAMDKLYNLFGIKKFALCGGSKINGAFMKEGLIDEIALVVAPFIEGTNKNKTIVEMENSITSDAFQLKEAKPLIDNGLLLIYKKI